MTRFFYIQDGKVLTSEELSELVSVPLESVLWIDLCQPQGEEKRQVEHFLDTSLSSRAQAEEIESSSRYSETENSISINTNYLMPGPDDYTMEAVSFVLRNQTLVSIRNVNLRSFTDLQRKVQVYPRQYPTGYHVLAGIFESRIDLDADMIEIMAREIDSCAKRVGDGHDMNQEFLLDINQLQENTMLVRENIVDKQRVISSILKSDRCPDDVYNKLAVVNKDIASLINHTNFSYERLDYLQNTVLGLINLEQNKIMKIFTFVSLLLMPPTLIASIYGMNVNLPQSGLGNLDFIILISLMVLTIVAVLVIFFKRRML
ncbi:MAG: magnesium and cobalt transport protein CorA [Bacteroidales bacterium]|nr:magnesium and cobalt transport protein CorA [Bacteroidales bacterium]